ncbi:MAG: hypothetical protein R3337_06570 [Gammaproteobacteria bacterium]|nr:hypothetical protein [Gammaproteobacteria bacterium]
MITSIKRFAVILMLAASLLSAAAAHAAHAPQGSAREVNLAADIGPDQAAAIVRDRTGGRVLGVRAVTRNGRTIYQVKVLKNGHVRVYNVDGASGNILG